MTTDYTDYSDYTVWKTQGKIRVICVICEKKNLW